MKIRRNDTVMVIAGKDKGRKGRVRRAFPRKGGLIVDGINMIKQHTRARAQARQAGIIERESPIDVSNVMLICSKCDRPTRIASHFLEDGKKVRSCRRCGEVMD